MAGVSFTVDMVYHGSPLRYDPRHDQSRIDPALPIDPQGDPSGTTLDYWPSYQGLEPRARATYLSWLDGGRTDASIPIGYVFIFFYGLEQRLLLDDSREEAPAIFAETRRLLSLHGDDYSFRAYAAKLLALSPLYEGQDDGPPTARCAESYDLEMPLDVRVRLGRKLRDGKAFDADDALRWVLCMPDVYLRTPGQRCFEELRALWSVRFAARHPDGLTIRRPKTTLKHEYRAASAKFSEPSVLADIALNHGFGWDEALQIAADPAQHALVEGEAARSAAAGIRSVPHMVFNEKLALSGGRREDEIAAAIDRSLSDA